MIRIGTILANIYIFKVNKKNTRRKNTKKSVKYVQSQHKNIRKEIYFENIFLIRTVQKCFYLPRKKVFCYYFENDSVFQLQPKLFFFVVIKSFSPFSKFFLHFEFFFLFFDFEIYFLTLKKMIYFEKVFFGMFRLPWKTNVLVSNFFFSVFD